MNEQIRMDELFNTVGGVDLNNSSGDPQLDAYHNIIFDLIEDARDNEETYYRPYREVAEMFFRGDLPALTTEEDEDGEVGRSTIVYTAVRDTIMAMLPSLVRIFTASDHVVKFVPNNKYVVEKAAEQTEYVSHLFWHDNEGFLLIHDILKDALNKAMGVVQWYTETNEKRKYYETVGIPVEVAQLLVSEEGVEDVDMSPPYVNQLGEPVVDLKYCIVERENCTVVEQVPPEEFRINKYAKTVKKARIVGRERVVPSSDLVELGYTIDQIENWKGTGNSLNYAYERIFRNPNQTDGFQDQMLGDEVPYGEWYVMADKDGDGINELRYIRTIGDIIIHDEVAPRAKFAVFTPDPEPHTVIGHSINEQMQDLQKIGTNVVRTTLDSLAASINPRMEVVENMVNMDDVMDDSIGSFIRSKRIGSVAPIMAMFNSQSASDVMNRIELLGQKRSGMSEASKGMDPKALQSTTVKGVDMVITGAQERTELVARILAETGFKSMFGGLLEEVCDYPNKKKVLKIRGKWVDMDPNTFDPALSVQVNPALGRGSDLDKFMILNSVAQTQKEILQVAGMDNPMVSPRQFYNTMEDILVIAGIRDADRYFSQPTDEQMAEYSARKAQQPNPELILAEAEKGKVINQGEKIKADTVKTMASVEQRNNEYDRDDKFRQTKQAQEMELKYDQLVAQVNEAAAKFGVDAVSIMAQIQKDNADAEETDA